MGTATAGSSGVPGDPGALRGAASSFSGASAHLDGLAGDLAGAAPGSWSGPASTACLALCKLLGSQLGEGSDALRMVAMALRQLAEEIEAAQEKAAAALTAAAEADAAADGLALRSSVLEEPEAAPLALIGQLRDEAFAQRFLAIEAREEAEAAALVAAGVFAQAAGMAPDPPPPPTPPDDGGGGIGGFFSDRWEDVKSLPGAAKGGYDAANEFIDDRQEDMDGLVHGLTGHLPGPLESMANHAYQWSPMSPKFSVDFVQGVGDWGVGMVEATPMLVRLSPFYGAIDPRGQREQQQQLATGLQYAWDHPGEMAKAATGWNHVENGEPGRMAGQAAPDVAIAILTGGGALATKTASTSSKVLDLAEDASTLQRATGGGAVVLDDVVRSGRVPENVVHDAQGRLLINERPPNNSGIFPGAHEKTGVPFTQEGFPDFYGKEGAVHVGAPNAPDGAVEIVMKGNRTTDFVEADRAAGITAAYRQKHGLTWHHLEDCKTMVLVDRTIHDDTGHHGAVSMFKAGICR
jgi:hypothetical protein